MNLTSSQQLAVETIDKSVLVAAGAGSGKTRVLVERFVEILRRRPEINVSNIMAVTYTRKAAAEMRTRLKERIQALVAETTGVEQERWTECLFAIDSARIGTIHSVCESVLRNFPAEAAVDPQFEIIDDLEREELVQSAIDQSFREIIIEQGSEHSILLSLPLNEIERCLRSIINYSIEFSEAVSRFENDDLHDFYLKLQRQLKNVQGRIVADIVRHNEWLKSSQFLRNNPLSDAKSKLEPFRRSMLGVLEEIEGSLELQNDKSVAQSWQALRSMLEIKPGVSGGNGIEAKSLREAIRSLRELAKRYAGEIPAEASESDCFDWELLTALIQLAKRAVAIYQRKKQESYKLDYNDLVLRTFSTLRQADSPVRSYYHNVLAEILVDEFQDTNRTQASLLAYLAGPRTNLFLIGDDKQSIYKFQGADVSIFNEWHGYFRDSVSEGLYGDISIAGERAVLSLGDSFRSHPNLVNFVNGIFKQLLGEEEVSVQYRARYRELTPARQAQESDLAFDASTAGNAGVEVISFNASVEGEKASAAASSQIESDLVADWIVNKVSTGAPVTKGDGSTRPIEYGDFGILVQRNSDCALLEPALEKRGVPYVAYTGKGFLDRQEVYDIESMLAFLANPFNDHALLAVLRSPICSLSDDLIHNLFANKAEKLWTLLQQEAAKSRPGYHAVNRTVVVLKRFLNDLSTKTLGELVQNIVMASNYDLILMGLPNGKQRSRNLWKLVNLASENEQMSCAEFVNYLKAMRQFGVKQSDAPVDTSNAVKVMTIHAAKGLEFPAVILPVLHVSANSKKPRVLFHRQYGFAFNTARTKDEPKPLWYTLATLLDKDMEIAEKKRLLYVAMTRARDYLALFINEDGRNEESFAHWLKPLLGLDEKEEMENSGVKAGFNYQPDTRLSDSLAMDVAGPATKTGENGLSLGRGAPCAPKAGAATKTGENGLSTGRGAPCAPKAQQAITMPARIDNRARTVKNSNAKFVLSQYNASDLPTTIQANRSAHTAIAHEGGSNQSLTDRHANAIASSSSPDPLNNVFYRTDLLEALHSETVELPSVGNGWTRVTPRSSEIQLDARMVGTFFHSLMEILPNRTIMPHENELLAIATLKEEVAAHPMIAQNLLREAKLLLDKFFKSDLHKLLLSAKRILHEIPCYKISSFESRISRPDLLVETADSKWVVVDYKTDHFPAEAIAAQARTHGKQLEGYCKDLADITGIPALKAIYFAQHGKLYYLE